jgi:hypothetical protein
MIGWHNFYYPIEKHLLNGDSYWKTEIREEKDDESEE